MKTKTVALIGGSLVLVDDRLYLQYSGVIKTLDEAGINVLNPWREDPDLFDDFAAAMQLGAGRGRAAELFEMKKRLVLLGMELMEKADFVVIEFDRTEECLQEQLNYAVELDIPVYGSCLYGDVLDEHVKAMLLATGGGLITSLRQLQETLRITFAEPARPPESEQARPESRQSECDVDWDAGLRDLIDNATG